MYGNKWVSAYGESDSGTWAKGLAGITGQQLGQWVKACLYREDTWPPTLPEFRAMCITKMNRMENAAMYRQFKALPRPPADKAKAREQFDIMRRAAGCVKA